jgi:seryl-tRNA synthetase
MLDIKLIRENPDLVKEKLGTRNEDAAIIDKLLDLDKARLDSLQSAEKLKELRNKVSDEIAQLKKNKSNSDDKISEMRKVSDEIKSLDEKIRFTEKEIDDLLYYIPALPHDSAPIGKSADENVEISIWGEKKEFDFKIKDHLELGRSLDILDFERGAKIAGSGFALYKGKGAILERALLNFMLNEQGKNGYKEVLTPTLSNKASMEAAEKIPKFEEDMYHIEKDELYAIPTAEVPILNIHRDEILKELPVRYCGFTNCFRREAGSYGKDTKGFLRVHQFNKVELFTFCEPGDSYNELERMLGDASGIIEKLGLHYRVLELCTADLAFSASKCYDLETWSYAEKKWLEVSSVSNYTDSQARRAKIRYKFSLPDNKSKTEFVHTLNGSGLATSRLIVSLLEANQTKEGNVIVPEVLRKYTGFDVI